jgi:hypothetical protein
MKILITESQLKVLLVKEDVEPKKTSERNYEQTKTTWSKINSDLMDRLAFGEGVSPSFESAKMTAIQNAKMVIAKKSENYHFKVQIKDTLVKKIKGRYHFMVLLYPIMDKVEFGSDAAIFVNPGDTYFS